MKERKEERKKGGKKDLIKNVPNEGKKITKIVGKEYRNKIET